MNLTFKTGAIAALFTALSAPVGADERILSIGGSITEIVYALGEQDRLIARDTTSNYPNIVETLPDVGYMRALWRIATPVGAGAIHPISFTTVYTTTS